MSIGPVEIHKRLKEILTCNFFLEVLLVQVDIFLIRLIAAFQSLNHLVEQLNASFCLPLHQKNHTFHEYFVADQLALSQFEKRSSFEIEVGLVKVLLLYFHFCNLIQGTSSQVLVELRSPNDLLKVQDCFASLVHTL